MTADRARLVQELHSAADECAKDAPLLRQAAAAIEGAGVEEIERNEVYARDFCMMRDRADAAEARAERLAEALRKVDDQLDAVECESSADARAVERCRDTIDAALAASSADGEG